MKQISLLWQKGLAFGWLPNRYMYGAAVYVGFAGGETVHARNGFRLSVLVYDNTYNRATVWTWWATRPVPKENWRRGWVKTVVGEVF
jgi:hypothetical protein